MRADNVQACELVGPDMAHLGSAVDDIESSWEMLVERRCSAAALSDAKDVELLASAGLALVPPSISLMCLHYYTTT